MEKIDLFFIALAIVGVVSMARVEFLNVTGDVVNGCYDSDNGKDIYTAGNLVGYDESTKRDFCVNENTLYEYYCKDIRSSGEIKVVECENGCVNEDGKGKCAETKEIKKDNLKEAECGNGCYFKGICYPFGARTNDGLFCDFDKKLDWQKLSDEECFNNFECKTNICAANKCISKEVFEKFLATL